MKKIVFTAMALAMVTVPMNSMAADEGFYLKANLGLGMAIDTDVDNMNNSTGSAKMTFENGFAGSIAAGYDFANPMRMEIELFGHKNDLDLFSHDTTYNDFNDGDLKTRSLMINGLYDVDTGSAWTPFAGLGIGISKLDINDPGFNSSESDNAFTYQFISGVAYAFNEQWSMDAQYRYLGTTDVTIDGADFNHSSNDLMLGLRYSF